MNFTKTDIDQVTRTRALSQAATVAAAAPSIHNTQPWHWRIHDGLADLYAEPARQLAVADPDRRMLTISCGAALHHARVALAAEGFIVEVIRLPDPGDPDLLARIAITGRGPVSAAATRRFETIRIRHSDRRPLASTALPADTIDSLRSAASTEGIGLDVLNRDQVIELAGATDRAQHFELDDMAVRAELDAWTGPHTEVGVPDANIPDRATLTTVPSRDFGHIGTLAVTEQHDNTATYAVLYSLADEPDAWLQAGEALSAVWLTAIEHGVSLLPLSVSVEEPATRQVLRHLLGGIGHPCIAMRIGVPDTRQESPPRTPRLPARVSIEIVN